MPFTPADGAAVELLPDGRVRLTADLVWSGTRGDAVLMPAGMISDGASVPRVARGIADEWGPIARAAFVHDVLCDAANEWSAQGCPPESRPRFLGPDIDGALRAAARDLGAAPGARWLYWVAVRWAALFGSRGRRHAWARTLWPVLALTLPALLVALPAAVGALIARGVLLLVDAVAWPWTRHLSMRARTARAPLHVPRGCAVWQLPADDAAQRLQAAQDPPAPALSVERVDVRALPGPTGPTSGPQQVVHARRVAARSRDREPAPWCATYLAPCEAWCTPSRGCQRRLTRTEETPR